MEKDAMITICGIQQLPDGQTEKNELVTRGVYRYEPGHAELSYTETEMTGMEGVQTAFTIEDDTQITLSRTGTLQSTMEFRVGEKHDSLYNMGFAVLLTGVTTRRITVLLNEKGGIFDLEYDMEIEHTPCGTNTYHISIRTLEDNA